MKEDVIKKAWTFVSGGMIESELSYIYDLCKDRKVLELGTYTGQAAFVMAHTAKHLTCVDIWDDTFEHLNNDIVQKNVYINNKLNLGDRDDTFGQFKNNCKEFIDSGVISFVKGRTQDIVNEFKDESFDIILIDADHSYNGVISDIRNYISKCKKDGVLVFHDYGCSMWTGVKQAAQEIEREGKISFVSQSDRIAIFKINQ